MRWENMGSKFPVEPWFLINSEATLLFVNSEATL